MSRAIVNCALGRDYLELQGPLREACEQYRCGAHLFLYDQLPDGCPPHDQQMYAFKIHALLAAINAGHESVLWIDCTFAPTASMEPLWEAIERDGWYAPPQGNSKLGTWCSDEALAIYGIDRDTAMQIPLVYSGLVGLDVGSERGSMLWKFWMSLYESGTFNGAHRNEPGEPLHPWGNKTAGHVSDDPRVEGHRHDEAALSFAMWSLGLTPKTTGYTTIESPDGFIARNFLKVAA